MGDIADMMLNGILCEQCGVAIGDEVGYPRLCATCQEEDNVNEFGEPRVMKVRCGKCGRKVKEAGLADHYRDKHGLKP